MRRTRLIAWMLLVGLMLLAAGCADEDEQPTPTISNPTEQPTATPTSVLPTATPLTEPLHLLAQVESLEVLSKEGEPADFSVRLRGISTNSCSRLDQTVTELKGDEFIIAVLEIQDPPGPGQECVSEETPFDTTVDLVDLEPGAYSVSAHGLQGTFTVEESSLADQADEPTSQAQITSSISGTVWHDLCVGTGGEQTQPPQGCIADEEGVLRADGLLQSEPGIEGVRVGISSGDCLVPATDFVLSDADGTFVFNDLPIGQYCVSIDYNDQENAQILTEGVWTTTDTGGSAQLVVLEDADGRQDVDFGWDFQFLPLAEFDPENCENSFAYLDDLNIPDDTEFAPNEAFTKRWLIQNNGTCPWIDEYSILFVGGDLMGAEESIPLSRPIAPGQSIEVAVDMIAPTEPGTYRGNWQVGDPDGEPFGIDGNIEDAFWLRITVAEGATPQATAVPGSGTIGGVVWDDFCVNSDPGTGCIEFPEDSGIFVGDGTFGPSESALADITITLASQSCPSDGNPPAAERVLATTVTSDDGLYRFQNLETGMYCIYMDALSDENVDFLIPGNWTWPATGVGRYTFFLDPGEQALDLDFGWDFVD